MIADLLIVLWNTIIGDPFDMVDLDKCSGEGCPLKENCYRYLAPSSFIRQAYFMKPPFEGDSCNQFMTVQKTQNFDQEHFEIYQA